MKEFTQLSCRGFIYFIFNFIITDVNNIFLNTNYNDDKYNLV